MSDTRRIVDEFWACYEAGNYEGVAALMAPDIVCRMPGDVVLHGAGEVVPMLQAYAVAIPDLHHELVNAIEDGDQGAYQLRISGHQTGPFATPQGTVPATGRALSLESVDVVRVADGRIASWEAYYDQHSFLGQLGLLPAPAAQG